MREDPKVNLEKYLNLVNKRAVEAWSYRMLYNSLFGSPIRTELMNDAMCNQAGIIKTCVEEKFIMSVFKLLEVNRDNKTIGVSKLQKILQNLPKEEREKIPASDMERASNDWENSMKKLKTLRDQYLAHDEIKKDPHYVTYEDVDFAYNSICNFANLISLNIFGRSMFHNWEENLRGAEKMMHRLQFGMEFEKREREAIDSNVELIETSKIFHPDPLD